MSAVSCQEQVEHTAPAIYARDSVPLMTSYGVNTLISDSGVIKYRIVTEEWIVNPNLNPSRYIFDKGVLLTQFDEKFNVFSYIQCDTAYYYDKKKLWELRSRVKILTKSGIKFSSEELFWDENNHELYSNKFSRLVTPERSLQGRYFRSDEQMTKYYVSNTSGSFVREDLAGGGATPAPTETQSDSTMNGIPRTQPRPRTNLQN
ncbi:MAG: LPS export ABC transporter periplasmic protein LptC [Prevotella sp.]|nr:LPS export ABC transporter periplasmic protein LptC [Prevotella sp.]